MEDERRQRASGPPTQLLQSYQAMGTKGRRKMQCTGGALITLATIAGLTVPLFKTVPIPYYVLVLVIFVAGCGFFWPQYGLLLFNAIQPGSRKFSQAGRPPTEGTETNEASPVTLEVRG